MSSSPGTMDPDRVFVKNYAVLRKKVNPRYIAAPLHAKGLISDYERECFDKMMLSRRHGMDRLLSAVCRTISVDRNNFYIFLEVLDGFAEYKPLVQRMISYLAGELWG